MCISQCLHFDCWLSGCSMFITKNTVWIVKSDNGDILKLYIGVHFKGLLLSTSARMCWHISLNIPNIRFNKHWVVRVAVFHADIWTGGQTDMMRQKHSLYAAASWMCVNKTSSVWITWHWGTFVQLLLTWKNNNYYIFWVCVCSLGCSACNVLLLYCHMWAVWQYSIFPHYLINCIIPQKSYWT
jgi:hypothetical protein